MGLPGRYVCIHNKNCLLVCLRQGSLSPHHMPTHTHMATHTCTGSSHQSILWHQPTVPLGPRLRGIQGLVLLSCVGRHGPQSPDRTSRSYTIHQFWEKIIRGTFVPVFIDICVYILVCVDWCTQHTPFTHLPITLHHVCRHAPIPTYDTYIYKAYKWFIMYMRRSRNRGMITNNFQTKQSNIWIIHGSMGYMRSCRCSSAAIYIWSTFQCFCCICPRIQFLSTAISLLFHFIRWPEFCFSICEQIS